MAYTGLLADLPADHRTVLVAGTTGEFPALIFAELGPERVIAHVGSGYVTGS